MGGGYGEALETKTFFMFFLSFSVRLNFLTAVLCFGVLTFNISSYNFKIEHTVFFEWLKFLHQKNNKRFKDRKHRNICFGLLQNQLLQKPE